MGDLKGPFFREVPGGVELRVWVQPGATQTEIAGMHGGALKVRIAAPAHQGRANQALVEFLAELLDLQKSSVSILRGEKTREKKVLLRGLNAQKLWERLP